MSCARRDCSLRKFNTEWDDFFLLYVILCLLSPFSACSACCRLFRWWSFHQHAESASPRRETHGLQFFFLLFLFNFFFAFEFSVFNFFSLLFFFVYVYLSSNTLPPMLQCRSKTSVLYFRYVRFFSWLVASIFCVSFVIGMEFFSRNF